MALFCVEIVGIFSCRRKSKMKPSGTAGNEIHSYNHYNKNLLCSFHIPLKQ